MTPAAERPAEAYEGRASGRGRWLSVSISWTISRNLRACKMPGTGHFVLQRFRPIAGFGLGSKQIIGRFAPDGLLLYDK